MSCGSNMIVSPKQTKTLKSSIFVSKLFLTLLGKVKSSIIIWNLSQVDHICLLFIITRFVIFPVYHVSYVNRQYISQKWAFTPHIKYTRYNSSVQILRNCVLVWWFLLHTEESCKSKRNYFLLRLFSSCLLVSPTLK